jgi:23S rRNA G2445 N2-methylase RlmL
MEGSTKVTIKASQPIVGTGTTLPIEITADFKDVPPHLHQLYMQSMWASYGSVNVYDNTNEEPKTIEEQKSEWRINKLAKLLMKVIAK